jgi:hypothetical protein
VKSILGQNCSDHHVRVLTGAGTVQITNNVSHTGLVTQESRQVDRLGLVILGERLHLSSVSSSTLAGAEAQRTVARGLKFTMRLYK